MACWPFTRVPALTAIELYIKTLETQLLTMPNDGYVRETVEACRPV